MRREYVGLGVLAIAVALALPFILSNRNNGPAGVLPTSTAVPALTQTPTPTSTSTPIPDHGGLEAPAVWMVTFYREVSGVQDIDDPVFLESIDLNFETPPFVEYRDGAWGVELSTSWPDKAEGLHSLILEYDCALTITLDGETVVDEPDPPGPRDLEVELRHAGGILEITIDAHDAPGPFLIRWK